MVRTALITGVTGQDGSYLAEYITSLPDYRVIGITRSSTKVLSPRFSPLIMISNPALTDPLHPDAEKTWKDILIQYHVDEVYHLASQTCKVKSLSEPLATILNTGYWTCLILEAIRSVVHSTHHPIRFFHASSSEIFGYGLAQHPQIETSPHQALSPYAVAKLTSFHAVQFYRHVHNLFAVSGILYNHESPRRGDHFVTSKIVRGVVDILHGKTTSLELGSLEVKRDWSDARDFVRGMHLTLTAPHPADYIFSSGKQHSVAEFCQIAFARVGLNYLDHVRFNPEWIRPNELTQIVGDPSLLTDLAWSPQYSFEQMIHHMVDQALQ